jgi:hypothetical protein
LDEVETMTALFVAIVSLLTLPCGDPIAWARHRPGGAKAYAAELEQHVTQAARTYDEDPFLVLAVAHSESGLDGTRVGPMGEVGLMQLMPHSQRGRAYLDAQGPQSVRDGVALLLGAEALHQGRLVCGNEAAAVGWYKSGRCIVGPKVRAVIALRDRLRAGGGV